MPKVDEWYFELTKLVDQSVFNEIFRAMYAKPKEEEEGKNITKDVSYMGFNYIARATRLNGLRLKCMHSQLEV